MFEIVLRPLWWAAGNEQPSPPLHRAAAARLLRCFDKYSSLYSRNMIANRFVVSFASFFCFNLFFRIPNKILCIENAFIFFFFGLSAVSLRASINSTTSQRTNNKSALGKTNLKFRSRISDFLQNNPAVCDCLISEALSEIPSIPK